MSAVFWGSFAVLWVLVVIQGFAFLEVLRQLAQIRKQLGPQQGALIVPGVVKTGAELPQLTGINAGTLQTATWSEHLVKDIGVIAIFRAGCTSCWGVAKDLTALSRDLRSEASIVALVEGIVDEVQAFIDQSGLDPNMVIIDEGGLTTRRLGVTFTPGAVTVRGRRLQQAAIVNSVDKCMHSSKS